MLSSIFLTLLVWLSVQMFSKNWLKINFLWFYLACFADKKLWWWFTVGRQSDAFSSWFSCHSLLDKSLRTILATGKLASSNTADRRDSIFLKVFGEITRVTENYSLVRMLSQRLEENTNQGELGSNTVTFRITSFSFRS